MRVLLMLLVIALWSSNTVAAVSPTVDQTYSWNTPLVIGDSLAVGATPDLNAYHISVDAQVGRQWSFSYRANFGQGDHIVVSGVSEAIQLRERSSLPRTVVVELGTNGPVSHQAVQAMLGALHGHRIALVTVYALPGASAARWTGGVNASLWWAHFTDHVPLILWSRAARPWLIDDSDGLGVHPTIQGRAVFARLIAQEVRR